MDVGRERFAGVVEWPGGRLDMTGRTLVMAVLNVTPDSFSDGGRFADSERAVRHGLELAEGGADVLDVGGQSTRPGSEPAGAEAEAERVVPVIRELAKRVSVPISIDTTESAVAEAALEAGASIINDISALRFDPQMASLAADREVPVVLMHMQGTPATMQIAPHYEDVRGEVKAFLLERMQYAASQGVDPQRIILDVGIGFGKRLEHNLDLLAHIDDFFELGRPVLVGHSRKGFLGHLLEIEVTERDAASLAVSAYLAGKGVHIVRVHQSKETRQAVGLIQRLKATAGGV